jgi:SNF2 family DNA or RNA helicase
VLKESDLRDYQKIVVDIMLSTPQYGLFLDMGLGKTVSVLTALHHLGTELEVVKPLIIAPKLVADLVWEEETKRWEHLKYMKVSKILGTPKQRIDALNTLADIYTINRENVQWLIEYYQSNKLKWDFDCIVIDESTSFKNPSSKRFKWLKKILPKTPRRYILTGTPISNGYLDLWSQIYILDQGERLGKFITHYRQKYFTADFMGYNWNINFGADKKILSKIKDITISMKTEDYLQSLPERINIFKKASLPPKLLKMYKEFEKEFILELELQQEESEELTASTTAVLYNKLQQFATGAIYKDEDNSKYTIIHDLKFQLLDEVIEENPNTPLLVAYNFKHELERIKERYPYAVDFKSSKDTQKTQKDWNEGKIKMLLVHPMSAGHGLNLQFGSNIVVWFGSQWGLEYYEQLNKRLHRSGQKEVVKVIHLIVGEIEDKIMNALANKRKAEEALIDYLKV